MKQQIKTKQQRVRHIAVIVDGNRRFAKQKGKLPWEGHKAGAEKLKEFLSWCRDANITQATLYTFSMQNFQRPKEEVDALMHLFKQELTSQLKSGEFTKHDVKVRFIGRMDLFSDDLQELMHDITKKTKACKTYVLNLAMGYGGREEIVDAVRSIIREGVDPDKLTLQHVQKHLYMSDEPDLIIRTGGAQRTSNFLAWQSTYSEWIFLDKYFPQLTKEDFDACLQEFEQRERRFGK